MAKIAVVGGSGNVATELLRVAIRSGKHQITVFTRSEAPSNPASDLTYQQVDYTDLPSLTTALKGFDTCLSFLIAHTDIDNTVQKNLVAACIAAGVRRFAPSEWALANNSGVKTYSNKDFMANYLADKKANNELGGLEYCLFQPSVFIDYFAHPHPLSPNLITWPFCIDYQNRRAIILDDGNYPMVLTAVSDVSEIVALALDDERPWPSVGGIQGVKTNMNEILALGKKIRSGEWQVEYVKSEDVEKGELKTSWVPPIAHPAIAVENREKFSTIFVVDFFKAMKRGAWNVSDEFNKRFPDYKFVQLEEYLSKAWEGKP